MTGTAEQPSAKGPAEATLDEVVALCKRRGFVFQSSEIYGGLGSTYDYGHYGVLLKNNVKESGGEPCCRNGTTWWPSTRRSSCIPAPGRPRATWRASPTRWSTAWTCKLRFRADKLEYALCGRKPSVHPGENDECDLTEPRQFNLMFETFMGPVRDDAARVFLRPETAQGIFVNFKNVLQFARRKSLVRHRADREGIPQRDHSRQLHLPDLRVRDDGKSDSVAADDQADDSSCTRRWMEDRMRCTPTLGSG